MGYMTGAHDSERTTQSMTITSSRQGEKYEYEGGVVFQQDSDHNLTTVIPIRSGDGSGHIRPDILFPGTNYSMEARKLLQRKRLRLRYSGYWVKDKPALPLTAGKAAAISNPTWQIVVEDKNATMLAGIFPNAEVGISRTLFFPKVKGMSFNDAATNDGKNHSEKGLAEKPCTSIGQI